MGTYKQNLYSDVRCIIKNTYAKQDFYNCVLLDLFNINEQVILLPCTHSSATVFMVEKLTLAIT